MENNLKITFWKNVGKIRKSKWISQEQLWYISKIHRTYISEIERWLANVTLEQVQKIANALDVDVYILFK